MGAKLPHSHDQDIASHLQPNSCSLQNHQQAAIISKSKGKLLHVTDFGYQGLNTLQGMVVCQDERMSTHGTRTLELLDASAHHGFHDN
ncbi:hypothetical protein M8C21_018408 [Ambrosia artemisiifolia]|uniref:Uncharacterized protein n=1 Tax=Ambrosia artemisiifolia TaxID=4212 RepID=A0AAD5G557_AMBAR|nr:hypothetical protein M8C21_018408 [Ambrosia artemisiifolia]